MSVAMKIRKTVGMLDDFLVVKLCIVQNWTLDSADLQTPVHRNHSVTCRRRRRQGFHPLLSQFSSVCEPADGELTSRPVRLRTDGGGVRAARHGPRGPRGVAPPAAAAAVAARFGGRHLIVHTKSAY